MRASTARVAQSGDARPRIVDNLGPNGGERDLLALMRADIKDAGAQAEGCDAVSSVCMEESLTSAQLMEMGVAGDLVMAMRAHAGVARVQELGCEAIGNVAHGRPSMRAKFVRLGAVGDVVAAMHVHMSNANVQVDAFGCVRILVDDEHADAVASAGVSSVAVEVLRTHAINAPALERMLDAMTYLSAFKALRVPLLECGAPKVVLRLMRTYAADPLLQEAACAVLANFAADETFDAELTTLAGAAAIKAMRTHASQAGVQSKSRRVLSNLLTTTRVTRTRVQGKPDPDNDTKAGDVVAEKLVALGATQECVKGLHSTDMSVLTETCRVLGTFACCSEVTAAKLVELGAVKDITALMRAHVTHSSLQGDGCEILGHLARRYIVDADDEDEANMEQLKEAGVAECAFAAVRAHPGTLRVATGGCRVLHNMSLLKECREQLRTLRAGGDLLKVMRAHAAVTSVYEPACNVLCNLTIDSSDQFKLQLMSLGAGRVLLRAMQAHLSCASLMGTVCLTVGRFANASASASGQLLTLGADQQLIQAMQAHPSVAEVQFAACLALGALAVDKEAREHMIVKHGAGDTIAAAIRTHATEPRVQRHGRRALCKLALDLSDLEI